MRVGDAMPDAADGLRRPTQILGFAGLLPFAGGALAMWLSVTLDSQPFAQSLVSTALLGYGAVIISFLGATQWGRALTRPGAIQHPWLVMGYAVAPSLVGWASLLIPVNLAYPIQALALLATLFVDRGMSGHTFPAWYFALRLRLTVGGIGFLSVAWLALLR